MVIALGLKTGDNVLDCIGCDFDREFRQGIGELGKVDEASACCIDCFELRPQSHQIWLRYHLNKYAQGYLLKSGRVFDGDEALDYVWVEIGRFSCISEHRLEPWVRKSLLACQTPLRFEN